MAASSADMTSILGSLLGQGAVTGSSIAGNNSAVSAQVAGDQAGINTLGTVQGQNANTLGTTANANAGILGTAAGTGAAADNNLATYLGLNGQPADFSQFYNTPGYQFAVQQGTNAINSQAAASGSAFTPNTLAAVGNYVQGAASTNYNNYINNLLQTSGQGITAGQGVVNSNTSLAEAGVNSNLNTGSSIAQLQGAQGSANASGALNQSGIISSALSGLGGASGIGALLTNLMGGSSNATGAGSTLSGLGTALNGLLTGNGTSTSAANTGTLGGAAITSPNVQTGDPGSGLDFSTGSIDLSDGTAANSDSSSLDDLLNLY